EGLGQRGADTGVTLEDLAQGLDLCWRPMRDIGERAVFDLTLLAEGFPQEDRRGRVAVGHDRDVHADYLSQSIHRGKWVLNIYMTTAADANCYLCSSIKDISLTTGGTSV